MALHVMSRATFFVYDKPLWAHRLTGYIWRMWIKKKF